MGIVPRTDGCRPEFMHGSLNLRRSVAYRSAWPSTVRERGAFTTVRPLPRIRTPGEPSSSVLRGWSRNGDYAKARGDPVLQGRIRIRIVSGAVPGSPGPGTRSRQATWATHRLRASPSQTRTLSPGFRVAGPS